VAEELKRLTPEERAAAWQELRRALREERAEAVTQRSEKAIGRRTGAKKS